MQSRVDIRDVAEMLRGRIEDLAAEIYPEGHLRGHEYRVGGKGSVCVHVSGPRAGLWSDWEAGRHGDPLEMVAHVLYAGDKRAALQWAREWLGLGRATFDPARVAEGARKRREAARAQEAAERERSRGRAAAAWLHASPQILGSPVDTYLQGRGIDLRRLPRLPAAVRFEPEATCTEDDEAWRQAGRPRPVRPALVAGLWAPGDTTPRAVQRTFLAADGKGKADLREPRKTLGQWPGAMCPVHRGPSGKRVREMEPGETVAVGEGLEEGLSIALCRPEWRVFACLYVANFSQVRLPVKARLMLCPNNDPADSRAAETFRRAVARLREQGHGVQVIRPPRGHKDWNAYLQAVLDGRA